MIYLDLLQSSLKWLFSPLISVHFGKPTVLSTFYSFKYDTGFQRGLLLCSAYLAVSDVDHSTFLNTQEESHVCSSALVHLQGSKGSSSVCTGEASLCLCGFDLHLQMPLGCKHNKSNMLLNPSWSKTCCAYTCPGHECSLCGSDRLWGQQVKDQDLKISFSATLLVNSYMWAAPYLCGKQQRSLKRHVRVCVCTFDPPALKLRSQHVSVPTG